MSVWMCYIWPIYYRSHPQLNLYGMDLQLNQSLVAERPIVPSIWRQYPSSRCTQVSLPMCKVSCCRAVVVLEMPRHFSTCRHEHVGCIRGAARCLGFIGFVDQSSMQGRYVCTTVFVSASEVGNCTWVCTMARQRSLSLLLKPLSLFEITPCSRALHTHVTHLYTGKHDSGCFYGVCCDCSVQKRYFGRSGLTDRDDELIQDELDFRFGRGNMYEFGVQFTSECVQQIESLSLVPENDTTLNCRYRDGRKGCSITDSRRALSLLSFPCPVLVKCYVGPFALRVTTKRYDSSKTI